jgi:hypothetical protein
MGHLLLLADGACGDGGVVGFDEIFADDFLRAHIGFGDFIGENFGFVGLGSMRVIEALGD